MLRIELREKLRCGIELFDRQNESLQHPRFWRTHIASLASQRGLERQSARWEHPRVVNCPVEKSAKRSGWHQKMWLVIQLIARRKLRHHAERGLQFAAGRNGLDPLFFLERALVVSIGQTPAWLDAKERAAIRPQSDVRNTGQIHYHPASTLRIDKRKLRPRNLH